MKTVGTIESSFLLKPCCLCRLTDAEGRQRMSDINTTECNPMIIVSDVFFGNPF